MHDTVFVDTAFVDTAFVDIDTQNDFLLPAGALYVPGAERIIPALARLYEMAKRKSIPVIASADAHTDRDPEFASWPPHCIAGTLGQLKFPCTLLPGAVSIPNVAGVSIPDAQQIIVEKETINLFDTATIGSVLQARRARRYVVFGVVTEICVVIAARGLLAAGHSIDIVTDAIASLDPNGKGQTAIDELVASGARLITSRELEG
jgi:nicotinamidase/pyrazinamidase